MEKWRKNLLLVWFSQLCSLSGFSAAIPFIPLYIKSRFGIADEHLCGFYVALFYFAGQVSFAIAAPIWGALADRYGRRLMLLRADFGGAIFFPLMMVADSVGMLIFLRLFSSGFSGTVNAAQTLIASGTPENKQGVALGILSSAVWSGNMLGFFLGGMVVEHFGFQAAFWLCGINFGLAGLVALFIEEDFVPPVGAVAKRRWTWQLPNFSATIWWLLLMFVFIGILRNFEVPYLALKIEQIAPLGRAAGYTGIISALAALAAIISGAVLGALADRYPGRYILYPALVITGIMNIVQGLTSSLLLFGSSRFVGYLFGGGMEPVLQRLLTRNVSPQQRGAVFGVSASARTVGAMLSVLFTGAIIYSWGTVSVFVLSGVLFLLLSYPAVQFVSRIEQRHF